MIHLKNKRFKRLRTILIWSMIALVFNLIYSMYAHGVSSLYMSALWFGILVMGSMPQLLLWKLPNYIEKERAYTKFQKYYYTGLATLAVGSLLKGILEIAGADSQYLIFYLIVGGILSIIGLSHFAALCLRFKGKFFAHHNAHGTGHH